MAEPEIPVPVEPLDQAAIDALDFSGASEEDKAAGTDVATEPTEDSAGEISAEELEALFAEAGEPEPAEAAPAAKSLEEVPEFDPESLARAQDAARPPPPLQDLEERRKIRREKRLAATEAHHLHGAKPVRMRPIAAIAMAAGIGSLATIGFLHNEVIRLFPASAPLFETMGIHRNQSHLDITDVRSKLVHEDNREMLEVSGTIINGARVSQKVPVLRLSIRAASGQEIYVWTATTDRMELGPGEKTNFTRRLASPPQDSHSVMVRFVAKDDIVAAIR